METIIIIALIGIVIYIFKFFYDRDKMLEKQVDENGGMLLKYKTLVNHFTNDPDAKVTSVTRDSINIKWKGTIFIVEIFILENFSFTKIECKLDFGPHGNHKKNWNYGKNQSHEKIVEDITNFMRDEKSRIFGNNQFQVNDSKLEKFQSIIFKAILTTTKYNKISEEIQPLVQKYVSYRSYYIAGAIILNSIKSESDPEWKLNYKLVLNKIQEYYLNYLKSGLIIDCENHLGFDKPLIMQYEINSELKVIMHDVQHYKETRERTYIFNPKNNFNKVIDEEEDEYEIDDREYNFVHGLLERWFIQGDNGTLKIEGRYLFDEERDDNFLEEGEYENFTEQLFRSIDLLMSY